MSDNNRTHRTPRSTLEANRKNEDGAEVHLLLRHFREIQVLNLMDTGLSEVVMVGSKRQPRIASVFPGRHRRERSGSGLIHRGIAEGIVQANEHDLFGGKE